MKPPPLPDTVTAWIGDQTARFRTHEHQPVYEGRQPRDTALIHWVIAALCDGACPWAAGIREHMDRIVAGHSVPRP